MFRLWEQRLANVRQHEHGWSEQGAYDSALSARSLPCALVSFHGPQS